MTPWPSTVDSATPARPAARDRPRPASAQELLSHQALTHEVLLTLARKVQAAADDADSQRLQQVVRELAHQSAPRGLAASAVR